MFATDLHARKREFDDLVLRQGEYAALRKEVLCVVHAAQDLQQDGDVWRDEGLVVDLKQPARL